jgi:hypothetical protein
MKKTLIISVLIHAFLFCGFLVHAQKVLYFENFENPSAVNIDKITRYPMNPEIIDIDITYPTAFPPASGRYAVRAQDKRRNYYGLGSIVAGPMIDLNNPQYRHAAIEAKIYITHTGTVKSDIANHALIAVDDSGTIEHYYRFGYAKGSIYFHFFNGSRFTESLYDPDLSDKLQIPGWHTFTMRFNGPSQIYCYVDNQLAFSSPIEQNDVTRFRMGVLGWDLKQFRPVIADDFKVSVYDSAPAFQRKMPSFQAPARPASKSPFSNFGKPLNNTSRPSSQPIRWFTDTNQALTEGKSSGKKFLLFFYLPGHAKTRQLEQGTFANSSVQATLSKFVPLKLNGKANPALTKRYGIFKYPTLIIIDMQGRIYWEYKGVISPDLLNRSLARF